MALGDKLKQARLDKGLTASEVAAVTRMKVQMIEDLEREDFSNVAATIYGKGFIRLYAEQVGLDSAPLIDEYLPRFVDAECRSRGVVLLAQAGRPGLAPDLARLRTGSRLRGSDAALCPGRFAGNTGKGVRACRTRPWPG